MGISQQALIAEGINYVLANHYTYVTTWMAGALKTFIPTADRSGRGTRTMKTIAILLGTLALAAAFAAHADAATYKKKKRLHAVPNPNVSSTYRDQDDSPVGYYEHRLEAVRFGSRRWWAIFDEQSGGGQRP